MKKTLLAITSALVLAGAMSSTESAQSAYSGYSGYNGDSDYNAYSDDYNVNNGYNGYNDRDLDGVDDRYDGDSRYADSRYAERDVGLDYDRDGLADRYDNDDDNDGLLDAQDPNDHDGRGYSQAGRYDGYGNRDRADRYDRPGRYGDGRHDNGRHTGWHMAKHRYQAGRYQAPRGYAYRQYQVGSRLPMGYYGSNYYVSSRPYALSVPPAGYRWNRVGSDAYLVNSSNGIIRDVIYSLFY